MDPIYDMTTLSKASLHTVRQPGRWLYFFLLLILVSCDSGKTSRRVTLWRKDKIPYGTYVAYENLKYIFPDAEISINRTDLRGLTSLDEGKKALIIIVPSMDPDASELNSILNFVSEGNHVFISAIRFGDTLLRSLSVRMAENEFLFEKKDSLRLSVYAPVSGDSLTFSYPGLAYDNYVSSLDSQHTAILGRDARGRPDLLKFTYKGGGSLLVQFAPMAFTNFFLLHKDNKAYYDNVLSYMPATVKEVVWDEYFRYDRSRNSNFSSLRYILSNPALRWAFGLLLVLLFLIYVFDSKRKQRIVPLIAGLRNNSLDFVKTIGRLYYQRRDNKNLAWKMSAHFQDHVRNRYNMTVSLSDPDFVERLSYRTGMSISFIRELTGEIQRLQDSPAVTDEELLQFNQKMEEFYKHV